MEKGWSRKGEGERVVLKIASGVGTGGGVAKRVDWQKVCGGKMGTWWKKGGRSVEKKGMR